tara:strand:- start:84 stop:341 length:258 start_codon:yes stop_codon:yes gene_type:complete
VALQLEIELEAKEGDRAEMEEQLSGAFGGVIKELQALAITLTLNLTLTLTHTPTPTQPQPQLYVAILTTAGARLEPRVGARRAAL